jgi:hypothetical protein
MMDGLSISLQDTLRVLVRQALAYGTALGELIFRGNRRRVADIRYPGCRPAPISP